MIWNPLKWLILVWLPRLIHQINNYAEPLDSFHQKCLSIDIHIIAKLMSSVWVPYFINWLQGDLYLLDKHQRKYWTTIKKWNIAIIWKIKIVKLVTYWRVCCIVILNNEFQQNRQWCIHILGWLNLVDILFEYLGEFGIADESPHEIVRHFP